MCVCMYAELLSLRKIPKGGAKADRKTFGGGGGGGCINSVV